MVARVFWVVARWLLGGVVWVLGVARVLLGGC